MYRVLRIAYSVCFFATCVKHNIISVIFNDTVQENISRDLAESMIMAYLRRALGRDVVVAAV